MATVDILARRAWRATGARAARADVAAWLPWVVGGLVVLLAVVPLLAMLVQTFRPPGVLPLDTRWLFTTRYYGEVFGDASTYVLLGNALRYAFLTIVFALPLALFFAWLVERTDMPGRSVFYSLMFVPMVLPGFFTALAWVQLLGPNAGALNVWMRDLFGLEVTRGPFNIFSLTGLVFVTVMAGVPSMWLLLLALFRNMDPALEDAASVAGAGRPVILGRITLPLLRPGLVTILVIYTLVLTELLEIPLILGLTAKYNVLSVQIFLLADQGQTFGLPLYGLAATFGLIALMLGAVLMLFYLYAVRHQEKFAVVTGKGYRPTRVRLGNWKYLCLGICALYLFLDVVLPFLIVFWTSLHRFYSVPSLDGISSITLDNFRKLVDARGGRQMLINTALVSVASSFTTMILSTLVAWLAVRRPSPVTRAINTLTFLPLAVPAPVAILGIMMFYLQAPLPIYGTLWILILAFTTRFLAYGTRLMHAAQLQIDKSLDEAAYVAGAGPLKTFYYVNLRLLQGPFIDGWLWVFAHTVRDFTVPLFLASGATMMLGNSIYNRWLFGQQELSSTYLVVLFGIIVVSAMLIRTFARGRASWGK